MISALPPDFLAKQETPTLRHWYRGMLAPETREERRLVLSELADRVTVADEAGWRPAPPEERGPDLGAELAEPTPQIPSVSRWIHENPATAIAVGFALAIVAGLLAGEVLGDLAWAVGHIFP